MSFFTDLGLAEPITRALTAKGYSDPTPIQREAIPALLEGRDLLGIAQTGTGKTAAFALPSLHRLAGHHNGAGPQPRPRAGCRMLVLSPTRELAAQIADNMRGYARFLDLTVQCVFGGVPVGKQAKALVAGCDVLVATPGRLLDLIDQRALTLRHVEIFVLDEADQMMDLGFIVPLKRVSALLPKTRQSLFFSATMPKAIADLGRQFIENPVRVEVTPQATTAERVDQFATHLNQAEKQALLTIKLRDGLADGSIDRALVFTRTKHGADRVTRNLGAAGIAVSAIHGNKSQAQRTAAIGGFRKGALRVLVATDIAARGIDIPGVSHVFNFEMPNVPEQYVHRIGRTARAGADGIALSFVAPDERPFLKDIERLTGQKLMPLALPEGFAALAAKLPAPARSTAPERLERPERTSRGPARGNAGDRRGDRRRDERPGGARPVRGDREVLSRDGSARPSRDERSGSGTRQPARGDGASRHTAAREGDARNGAGAERGFGTMPRSAPSAGARANDGRGDSAPRGNGQRDSQRNGGRGEVRRNDGGRNDGRHGAQAGAGPRDGSYRGRSSVGRPSGGGPRRDAR